ncbi:MAG: hypothetical protein RL150_683 [Candidatus Parcubacteria bacterium]|jgi:succinylglutamate desuccinylase
MNPKEKYTKLLDSIATAQRPIVFINGCTHGDERVGLAVTQVFADVVPEQGTLLTNIANEQALEKGVRYINHDINRVGVGNEQGSYEEQLAFYLSAIAAQVDVFIDIHSTESSLRDAVIVDHLDQQTQRLIDSVQPSVALVMRVTEGNVLLSSAKAGIAFEYGNDADPAATQKIITDIKKILHAQGMLTDTDAAVVSETGHAPAVFIVEEEFPKDEGDQLDPQIANLQLVQKGQTVYRNAAGEAVPAEYDFFPVLFSQNGYKNIFGFVGRRVEQ